MKTNRKQSLLIAIIFILSLISLLDCFFFLEFWYAKKDGLENGFHIFNTSYSIFYWFSHVSYWSCIFITLWSGFELLGLYYPKYRPRFIFRYFAIFWITLTMFGESLLLPSMMRPRIDSMMSALFDDGPWMGINGFWYSFLDFFQFISIHITIPIISIIYASNYKHNDITRNEKVVLYSIMTSFMISWFLYSGFGTLFGMSSAYPIIDWTPDGRNDWPLWIQIMCCIDGLVFFILITYLILEHSKKINLTEEPITYHFIENLN